MSSPPVPPPVSARPDAAEGTTPRRLDGSMSLLVDVMTNTLDEAYAERAARKAGAEKATPSARGGSAGLIGRVGGALTLVLLGLLTGTAVSQVRDRAAASEGLRAELADQVRARESESDRLSAEAADLRTDVTATRDAALAADAEGARVADQVRDLELGAATIPVTGPGIVLTVDDAEPDAELAPESEMRGGSSLDGRVLDRDLQDIANGLWAAGAEAMAINGVRLSSRAAIRSAGEAILVDFRPLSPPYRLEAIGRSASLEVDFLDGDSGRRLQTLASFSGITWELERADRLTLPAATEPQLRAARPLEEPS